MSLVRLLGFETLRCGCVIGRYHEVSSGMPIRYVEEKGPDCQERAHRKNHAVSSLVTAGCPAVGAGGRVRRAVRRGARRRPTRDAA